MTEPKFSPGFRFSTFDAMVLIFGTLAAVGVAFVSLWIGMAIAFVVSHFFLFCNILRMSRPLELTWAAAFAVLAVCATQSNLISWPVAFLIAVALTFILTLIETRRPSYHGVGWKTINPHLPEWWRANVRPNG